MIKAVGNDDTYNHIELSKSQIFLDNLQDFVLNIGLVGEKQLSFVYNDKKYDINTFFLLFEVDEYEEVESKNKIEDINGRIYRYDNEEIELLVIFFSNSIELIFYCDKKNREMIIEALKKFCDWK